MSVRHHGKLQFQRQRFLPLNKRCSFADGCSPRKGPGRWEAVPPPHFIPLTRTRLYMPGHRYCSGNYKRSGFYFFDRCLYVCLIVERFWKRDSAKTLQDSVMTLYRCVVKIKIKAKSEDRCGPTHE